MCVAGTEPGGPRRCSGDSRAQAARSRAVVTELAEQQNTVIGLIGVGMGAAEATSMGDADAEWRDWDGDEDPEVTAAYEELGVEDLELGEAMRFHGLYTSWYATEPADSPNKQWLWAAMSAYERRIGELCP